MTWYLTIRSDAGHSRQTATGPLVEHLRTFHELRQDDPTGFSNSPGHPWVRVYLVHADESGNYARKGEHPSSVNKVDLICSDMGEDWHEALSARIASYLGWEAVEEHAGRRIYPE